MGNLSYIGRMTGDFIRRDSGYGRRISTCPTVVWPHDRRDLVHVVAVLLVLVLLQRLALHDAEAGVAYISYRRDRLVQLMN